MAVMSSYFKSNYFVIESALWQKLKFKKIKFWGSGKCNKTGKNSMNMNNVFPTLSDWGLIAVKWSQKSRVPLRYLTLRQTDLFLCWIWMKRCFLFSWLINVWLPIIWQSFIWIKRKEIEISGMYIFRTRELMSCSIAAKRERDKDQIVHFLVLESTSKFSLAIKKTALRKVGIEKFVHFCRSC